MLIGASLNIFEHGMYGLFLFLDAIVYWLVHILFRLFNLLAGAQILTESSYNQIVQNVYVVLGVAMLFYISYALLRSLINPDDFGKNTSKIVINALTSLVLLGIVPVIFTYAFSMQNIIIEEDIIDGIIFGEGNNLKDTSSSITFSVLNTFTNPSNKNIEGSNKNWEWFAYGIKTNASDISFFDLVEFAEPLGAGEATYIPIVSTLCGLFMAYMLFSFCLDLAVRVSKLAFYQIIAPIPIIMRIIPEKKSSFDNWLKGTIATYMEVFIRMFVMFIAVFLAGKIANGELGFSTMQPKPNPSIINTFQIQNQNNVMLLANYKEEKEIMELNNVNIPAVLQLANPQNQENPSTTATNAGYLGLVANCLMILGVIFFAKKSPKIITNVIGFSSEDFQFGITGKLSAMGAFAAAGFLGGGATTGLRNFFRSIGSAGWDNVKNAHGFKDKAKVIGSALWKTTGGAVSSGFAGAMSGGVRSGVGGWKAKNFKEMATATHQGIENAEKAREKRLSYKASHGNNPLGVATGHIGDLYHGALDYLGIGPNVDALKRESELLNDISSKRKAAADAAEAEINKKINVFESTVAQHVDGVGYTSLSVLDNVIETIKAQGSFVDATGATITDTVRVAEKLNRLQKARVDLKDDMVKQYLSGVDLDNSAAHIAAGFTHGAVSKRNIAGPVQDALSALNTSIKNNIGAIERNLTSADLSDPAVRAMQTVVNDFIRSSHGMNIGDILGNAAFDIGEIADNIKKYAGTASTNVNTRLNEFRQQEAQRNGNSGSGGH